jgi:hypothetical protein
MAIAKIDNTYKTEIIWEKIKTAVDNLDYGSVIITVHDGKIVQVETSSKQRF